MATADSGRVVVVVRRGCCDAVGLHEHGVDLFETGGFGAVAHGFDEGSDTEVPDGTKDTFGDAQDEVEGFVGEGVFGNDSL
ncbi:MAG: hypothetical protein K9N23_16910 [Akkermansiaceae bacterium]|nr:hypothetical protein [Akkermansiaceae bacterium]MCF7733373.1 hypothetical protein [Akkermansiaceae bacterium]